MNTGRAKKIRKSIYGDNAHRPVKYVKDSKGTIPSSWIKAALSGS